MGVAKGGSRTVRGVPLGSAARGAPPGRTAALRDPVVLAAGLLIGVSLALRVLVLGDSYFVEDDLVFVGNAYESGLTLDFVTRIHSGHLMPGSLALTWVLSRVAPYDWTLAAGVTLLAQALLGVLALRLLRLLFGTRPMILPLLAVLLFCPLTIPSFGWWAAAINAVPLQLALVLALTAQVRFARGEGVRYGLRALGWFVAGMAFSTKGIFVGFVLLGVTTAFLRDRETGWARSVIAELRGHRRLWGAYAAVMAAYTGLYLVLRSLSAEAGGGPPVPGVALELVGTMLGRTFPAGAVGGPLTWTGSGATGGLAAPPDALVAVAWLVTAALVGISLAYRRRALRAWVLLGAYLLAADAVPTVVARGGAMAVSGAEPRYVADAVVMLMLCLGFALLPVEGERDAYRRPLPAGRSRAVAAVLAAGAYLAVSTVSIEGYRATLTGDLARAYLTTAEAELAAAPDDAVIYPTPVPRTVMVPWLGDERLSSRALAPLARPALRFRMANPEPTHDAKVFDRHGRLADMGLFGFFQAVRPGERCLPVTDGAVIFPDVTAPGGPATAGSLSYSAVRPASVTFEVGEERLALSLRATPGDLIHFPVRGVGEGVRIVIDDPAAQVCLTGMALGTPVAEGEEPA
ncbi:membrane protein [Planomonospora sphaerica]|uniref:Membrane protein n=1 Tax=Planomonospora sphaerica TaxID=161355 RepID=A0A161LB58_9ACTN|nr:hypothetical protein [Planomonospora sphaerica]GAT65254.1 membrane protein [Planomonospora sphaerica]